MYYINYISTNKFQIYFKKRKNLPKNLLITLQLSNCCIKKNKDEDITEKFES